MATVGRKKAFDEEAALQAAMDVFWKKGYIGASLATLTEQMGITKPSMYSTFGNKEELFIKATELYIKTKVKIYLSLLSTPNTSLKQRLQEYMKATVARQCESRMAKGCLLTFCQAEMRGGDIPDAANKLLTKSEQNIQSTLTELLENDTESQALGLSDNAQQNALCIIATLKGTSTLARINVPQAELEYIVDNCLQGLGLLTPQ